MSEAQPLFTRQLMTVDCRGVQPKGLSSEEYASRPASFHALIGDTFDTNTAMTRRDVSCPVINPENGTCRVVAVARRCLYLEAVSIEMPEKSESTGDGNSDSTITQEKRFYSLKSVQKILSEIAEDRVPSYRTVIKRIVDLEIPLVSMPFDKRGKYMNFDGLLTTAKAFGIQITLDQIESHKAIAKALDEPNVLHSLREATDILGIHPKTLERKMNLLGITALKDPKDTRKHFLTAAQIHEISQNLK